MPNFVHLHLHTEYALVDSLIRIKPLVKAVRKAGMPACAVTDYSNLFALVKFYCAAQSEGIKPIIGVDVRLHQGAEPASRLVLLCQNDIGYRNLTRLVSRSYTEGQENNVPYLHRQWLNGATEGIIALSGGCDGEIGQALLAEHPHLAKQRLDVFKSLFPQRFYIELQRTGRHHEEEYIHAAVELALETDIPVVATNEVCFLNRDDFESHEVRVCIHDSNILADKNRPHRYSEQQYLRTPQEMAELFSDIPEAIENTWLIAQRCNLELTLGKNFLPDFPIPEGETVEEYFRNQARIGLEQRLAFLFDRTTDKFTAQRRPYDERLALELDVIIKMGFPGYFLIVADFIQWAKENDIPVGPGRGSGAGSLVAYALKITDLDPIHYDLLFERFLNPERVSMPDFDIDFCIEGRDEVINYVAKRYGRERVSQIITYGTMAAKAVVRDVGRVLAYPHGFVDKIAKLIPFELGITLDKALEKEDALRTRYEQEEDVRALINMARKLEGLTRNSGKHAGGVVIAPSVLTDFTPLYCEQDSSDLMTQFDKGDVEAVGLVKFDFLGLRTLTIIKWALQTINHFADKPIDILKLPLNDPETYNLLKRGDTTAVFQLESSGIKKLIRRLRPDCFEDIIALVALYRPGPLQSGMVDDFIERKQGRAKVEYPHPDLAPILKPTYGVMVYQEQVMQIAQVLAGYTLGGADLLRRAISKKIAEEMAKQRSMFVEGATKRGVKEKTATYVFDLIDKFSGYGFNRCLNGQSIIADPATGERHSIEELHEWHKQKSIISLQDDFNLGRSQVVKVMKNGIKPVFKLTTSLGKEITATANHPFLTLQGWKPLEELKPKDRIAAPARLPIEGTDIWTDEKLITLGWTLSDSTAIDKLFPPEIFRLKNKGLALLIGRFWSGDGFVAIPNETIPYVATSSLTLARQLQHLLLRLNMVSRVAKKAAGGQRIGYTVSLLGRTSIEHFVECLVPHLIGKDKQVKCLKDYLRNTPKNRESLDTIPAEFKFGVREEKERHDLTWQEIETGSGVSMREFHGSAVRSGKRGFRRETVHKIARFFNSDKLQAPANPDIFWESIVSIEQAGTAMTYDLEVSDTHNFVADDIIVHNSHSAAYALLAYQTAWLKAHYPAAFMAAVLSADMDNTDKVVSLIEECRAMKLKVLPPNINVSHYKFTVADDQNKSIHYGLGAIKGAGEAALEGIVAEREEKGRFTDLFDFCNHIDLRKASRRILEPLIKTGALDELGPNRAVLMASLDSAIKSAERHSTDSAAGQNDIFGGRIQKSTQEEPPFVKNIQEWSKAERLKNEKEGLGFYLSGHPITPYLSELAQLGRATRLATVKPTENKQTVRVAGWVTDLRINTKRGRMAFITLDDSTARMEVKIYSELYATARDLLVKDTLLIAEGEVRVDDYNDGYTMTAKKIDTLETAREQKANRLELSVSTQDSNELAQKIVATLTPHLQGQCRVFIDYQHQDAQIELQLDDNWKVKPSTPLIDELKGLLGEDSVKVR